MDLKRNIVLKINGNDYQVTFPTVGQFIDIESKKAMLTRNQYGSMILSGTKIASKALDYVDMLSYFSVLVPDLIKDSKVSLLKLDIMDGRDMLKVYLKEFKPWMEAWTAIINKSEEEEEKEREEKESAKFAEKSDDKPEE